MRKTKTTPEEPMFAVRISYNSEPGGSYLSFHRHEKNAIKQLKAYLKTEDYGGERFSKKEIVLTGRDGDVHTGRFEYNDSYKTYEVVPLKLKD